MDGQPPKRPRIAPGANRLPAIHDTDAFVKNKSSDNAKQIAEVEVSIGTHLWFDKHYQDRHQFGDNDGARVGIDPETVQKLVKKSIPHLLFYSTAVRGFHFVNYNYPKEKPAKIVLKEETVDGLLNVVIEVHYTELSRFEITVKTAMCTEGFNMFMGQFSIDFQGDTSTLYRMDNTGLTEVCNN